MPQFRAKASGVEIDGSAILAVLDGMGTYRETALRLLERYGIQNPQPGEWYPQQKWLDAFREIADSTGPNTLKVIGRRIPETTELPPEVDTIEKALGGMDGAYHLHHRGGEIGHYHSEKSGDRSMKVVCDDPYPCQLTSGIIESTANMRAPKGGILIVKHDDSAPCKQKGGESCTYLIRW